VKAVAAGACVEANALCLPSFKVTVPAQPAVFMGLGTHCFGGRRSDDSAHAYAHRY